ncbi:MAG TPA: hypothetical protein VM733_10525 [Thermoanaerobaculia bacterium]|nr:hypothetical protein [Thermoanaerobaculia bacterium]
MRVNLTRPGFGPALKRASVVQNVARGTPEDIVPRRCSRRGSWQHAVIAVEVFTEPLLQSTESFVQQPPELAQLTFQLRHSCLQRSRTPRLLFDL